ncbi:hypothetical protein JCM8547_004450 [Rhodosporidiobolus lusitaniae]
MVFHDGFRNAPGVDASSALRMRRTVRRAAGVASSDSGDEDEEETGEGEREPWTINAQFKAVFELSDEEVEELRKEGKKELEKKE